MSHKVIYLRAVSVNAWQNALWTTTLTEERPMCKGECADDLCHRQVFELVKREAWKTF